jgi:3-deoxy-7-phosphoheptulonate synthase
MRPPPRCDGSCLIPLALDQCSAFVSALPQARAEPFLDTREAMRAVAEAKDPTLAAIGSPEAAAAHELHILNRNVGNQDEILMRYVALARAPISVDVRVPCKTSLILSTRHEKGALLRCLHILAEYGLSMTKLESRPRPNRPWEYMFFIDFEGNVAEERAALALEALRSEALYLKILGCYPAKATPAEAQTTALPEASEITPVEASPAAASAGRPASSPPVARASKHYRLADRATHPEDTVIRVGSLLIGGTGFVVIAGPCSVESEDQINRTALFVREQGAHILRGGVFKPRTGPYAFQGLGRDGLDLLVAAGKAAGLPIITEVMTIEQVHVVAEKSDILQIGARNMQNFPLLSAVGKVDRPVLLKRGLSSTIEEWLAAAEYILAQGNGQVILCERGIRTFESATRNTLDLSAVVVLRERTHLPIVVDPSHGTGKRLYVAPMAWAARACGAHGISIEVHPDPDKALSDGDQSLDFPGFKALMEGLSRVRV